MNYVVVTRAIYVSCVRTNINIYVVRINNKLSLPSRIPSLVHMKHWRSVLLLNLLLLNFKLE